MSSLEHLLCPDTIERRPIDGLHYSNQHDAMSSDSSARPNLRRCSVPDCQKTAKRGGRCISHGGGNKCAVDGCITSVVSRGLCVAHGGGKRCQTQGCTKSAQSGGSCWVHGGGKKCGYLGCPKRAQSGGACIAHGGGKRCRIDGCNKVVQYDGLCVGHGGYRRCIFENCDRRAMANDYCQQHGGSSVCLLEYCYKRAVRGGMCSEHKAEASLQAVTASGLSTPSQSSDEDRDHRVGKPTTDTSTHRAPRPHWRSNWNAEELTRKSSPEPPAPNSYVSRHVQMYGDISTRPPSPVGSGPQQRNEIRRVDSTIAPGFSALLNANDEFPSLSSYNNKIEASTERYVRRQHQLRHQEHKVFPLLPSIQALQNYRSGVSSIDKSLRMALVESTVATLPSKSELRIMVTEDRGRLKRAPSTEIDHRGGKEADGFSDEPTPRKIYVHSYYYQKNDGVLPCSTTPTRRHGWGRRHA
ncbi:hypothetical protein PHYPSEUDO_006464 [Phytophthora pseudosyringae]|uniref:WRKY19-like zinc finger domain-containing protein n=1 Tax=Phytophthora pseudosyringae TaxID=221518 RepID=A0A8T1VLM6_9STRA|nr:hypothetical protein PHYPSEUDO_006464 [Phytophthora pseudosyringae]